VVTGQGLEISDNQWKNFRSIPFLPALQFDPMTIDYSITIFHLKDHRVAVVGGGRIVLYDPQSSQFKSVSVSNPAQGRLNLSLPVLDMQGRLVFEYQNHVYRLEEDDHISLLWVYPAKQGIRSIHVDRTNTLWVGTDPDGLYKINLLAPEFESHHYTTNFVNDVLVNEVGVISSRLNAADINPYYSRNFITDEGNLLLYIYITNQGAVIAQLHGQSLDIILDNTGLGQIAKGKNGELRFLNSSGFLYTWSNIHEAPEILKIDPPSDPAGTSMITSIAADDTSLWVSSLDQGIHQFTNGKFVQTIDPTGAYPINIIRNDPDRNHVLWIGTISGGLYKWDKAQNKLMATYTTANGLPNNTVYSLVPDAMGYLWMSTNKGIVRFNPDKETFTNYTTANGLIESEFNRHHSMQLPDGRIAMGGTKGYTVFDPLLFAEDTSTPAVFITRVAVNDQWIDPINDRTFLTGPVNLQDMIELSHDENSIAFQVAATQYNESEKIKYRYMLERYNRNWVVNGPGNEVRFDRLPSGKYTLLLNASNTLGIWSPEIRKLRITVHPPFWLTWWAYSFYALAVGLTVRGFWGGYKRRLKARQEAEFNVREAARLREVDEIKTRFFSNITHEFRTPLTLIMSPLEKHLSDLSLPPKAITLLNNNYRHASQLLTLVNQLLDIAKIEARQMPVNLTAGELKPFAGQVVESFQALAEKKQITLHATYENIHGHYLFDREKWEAIMANLLSNAIKFTPQNGSVQFLLREEKDPEKHKSQMIMRVSDTGTGIPSDKLHRIFERFLPGR
jgi:signal transduction histidine kinase/streptogramin lyase